MVRPVRSVCSAAEDFRFLWGPADIDDTSPVIYAAPCEQTKQCDVGEREVREAKRTAGVRKRMWSQHGRLHNACQPCFDLLLLACVHVCHNFKGDRLVAGLKRKLRCRNKSILISPTAPSPSLLIPWRSQAWPSVSYLSSACSKTLSLASPV